MTSNRDRQRATARARLEREMAERAQRSRRRRRTQTIAAASAGALVVILGVVWLVVALQDDDKGKQQAGADPSASAAPTKCDWLPLVDPSQTPKPEVPKEVKDVGTPPATGEPRTGKQLMTLATSIGEIRIEMDTAKAPCASASFTYLASKQFFDNTKCHRMVTKGIHVLQCGDPSATSLGGPTYRYAEENLPTGRRPAYAEGVVAIAKSQQPSSSGSQFFIVFKDTDLPADYTVLGRVTAGLEHVKKVAEAGVTPDPQSGSPDDGAPKTEVKVNTVTVGPVSA